jgi:phosphoribosyl-ATP pyrophosphohydrolase/phosphoribosyl-AMP cyclohydrolase
MKDVLKDIKFDDKGLIPAITQDCRTEEVLMLAYMNAESLGKTIETGKATYFSRSRQELWVKGGTSGHCQYVKSISLDCDKDTLLLKVEQVGAACHTGHHSCFFTKLDPESLSGADEKAAAVHPLAGEKAGEDVVGLGVMQEVYDVIADRAVNPKEGSYTNYLLQKGLDKILKKVGEEASEVIIAGKNNSRDELGGEVADLFYHLMVLLVERGMKLEDICVKLKERR